MLRKSDRHYYATVYEAMKGKTASKINLIDTIDFLLSTNPGFTISVHENSLMIENRKKQCFAAVHIDDITDEN